MAKSWLFLDCSFLCHRVRFKMGDLSFQGVPTAVCFGFLRDVLYLQEYFSTNHLAFCFDSRKNLREKFYTGYKEDRRKKYTNYTEEELADLGAFRHQVKELRTTILPELGFRNIFVSPGFEADDLLASCCEALTGKDDAVIVGSDKDLYQLLSPCVVMFKIIQKKVYTEKDLAKDFCGIEPSQWHMVKALAGCKTDSIPGIPGVGEKTAAKFLKTLLNEKSLAYKNVKANEETWRRNIQLTKLPYPGTPKVELVEDEVTDAKWRAIIKKYDMKSLLSRI